MFAAVGVRVVAENFEWHGGAAIDAIARADTNRENGIAIAGVFESALDYGSGARVFERKCSALERNHFTAITQLHGRFARRIGHDDNFLVHEPPLLTADLGIHLRISATPDG